MSSALEALHHVLYKSTTTTTTHYTVSQKCHYFNREYSETTGF